ncbi:MAG TPA: hypothetical protein VFW01_04100 [bacterium]|nr:hypothetical protein [bacterium]
MSVHALRAWVRAVVLVPAVFALVIAAVSLAAAILAGSPAGGRSHPLGTVTADQPTPSPASAQLTLPVALRTFPGSFVVITIRITTDPPAPAALDASREYVTTLLHTLVRKLPAGWRPDAAGLATLKQAIEEAVPEVIAAKLPGGTHVTASAEVTTVTPETPDAQGSPEAPAAPGTQTVPPSP